MAGALPLVRRFYDLGFNIGARPDAAAKEDQKAEEPEYQ